MFDVKSVTYLQITTINHVNFYMPNSEPQAARRLFYVGRQALVHRADRKEEGHILKFKYSQSIFNI